MSIKYRYVPPIWKGEDIMPVTEKKYPEWVQKHHVKGTTVKKKGGFLLPL